MDRRDDVITRRELLRAAGLLGAAGIVAGAMRPWPAGAAGRATNLSEGAGRRLVARAAAARPAGSDLGAVDHVVFLMMENRSYDHYFGRYHAGRGFNDHPAHSLGAFSQAYPDGGHLHPPFRLLPFHLDPAQGEDCTTDLTHAWGPMHQAWNGGAMDRFVQVHTSSANEGNPNGALTMGYYDRSDLGFYYAAADAFTLCDAYHCSVLGPTHPNRLMATSGTIDPAGSRGGPVTDTNPDPTVRWSCTWPTVQEVLEDAGVSWKVYNPSSADVPPQYAFLSEFPTWDPALYNPTANPEVMGISDTVLAYFKSFEDPTSALYQKAFLPTFPGQFLRDVTARALPSVSWIIPPAGFDEHPSCSPARGMWFTAQVLKALASQPDVWSRTVLFLMYDESDGWFDHVPPPTPPRGTAGEYITSSQPLASDTLGIRGPVGLGLRVPMLVMSPFSRGGHVVSETFDHTSQLRFLAARFGIEVPNVSAWRRRVVGDLTATLFNSRADTSVPRLPEPGLAVSTSTGSCSELDQDTEFGGASPAIPANQTMPSQEPAPRGG